MMVCIVLHHTQAQLSISMEWTLDDHGTIRLFTQSPALKAIPAVAYFSSLAFKICGIIPHKQCNNFTVSCLITLATSSGKCIAAVWCPSVCLSHLFLAFTYRRGQHARGQRIRSDNKEDRRTYCIMYEPEWMFTWSFYSALKLAARKFIAVDYIYSDLWWPWVSWVLLRCHSAALPVKRRRKFNFN